MVYVCSFLLKTDANTTIKTHQAFSNTQTSNETVSTQLSSVLAFLALANALAVALLDTPTRHPVASLGN